MDLPSPCYATNTNKNDYTKTEIISTNEQLVQAISQRETHRQTDRQTDGRTDGQTDRQTDRQTDGQTDESSHALVSFIFLCLLIFMPTFSLDGGDETECFFFFFFFKLSFFVSFFGPFLSVRLSFFLLFLHSAYFPPMGI